jgi:hypothetical protein
MSAPLYCLEYCSDDRHGAGDDGGKREERRRNTNEGTSVEHTGVCVYVQEQEARKLQQESPGRCDLTLCRALCLSLSRALSLTHSVYL